MTDPTDPSVRDALTDEQIEDIWNATRKSIDSVPAAEWEGYRYRFANTFARAIEAALSKQEAATPAINESAEFEKAFLAPQPNWTFEDDGCGGYHHGSTDWAWQGWQARAALKAAQPVPRLVMADGSPLLDYLNVPPDSPQTDEWTAGYHEARRRLYKILAPQLAPAPQEPAEPVARVLRDGATVRLEWASVEAAHNAKPGPLYTQSVADAQDAGRYRWIRSRVTGGPQDGYYSLGEVFAYIPVQNDLNREAQSVDEAIDAAMALDVTNRDPKGD
jgi:hypothetical protein